MKIIKQEYNEDSGDDRYIYEATYEELIKYLDNPPSWELTIKTSKGEWTILEDFEPEEILTKDKTYQITEFTPLDDRTFIYIKEVR